MWSIFKNKKIAEQSKTVVFETKPKTSGKKEILKIEADLFLEAIFQRYGKDFRNYSRASMMRRINSLLSKSNKNNISELIYRVLYDEKFFNYTFNDFSITVTEMFRDPLFYKNLREKVIPNLVMYPSIKIWLAGCSSGEEIFSLAIVLKEAGIYDKSTIYVTDSNNEVLERAKQGIYPLKKIQTYTSNYQQSGGIEPFSNYYYAQYDSVIMNKSLKERIVFSNHNLIDRSGISDVHLVFCRNMLIYFNAKLQNEVLQIFSKSLVNKGYLCLGNKENIEEHKSAQDFDSIGEQCKIFQKKNV